MLFVRCDYACATLLTMRLRSFGAHEILSTLSVRFCGVSSPRQSRYLNFEQAQSKRCDVAIMMFPIHS